MQSSPCLSVVVPFYNAGSHFTQLLNSLEAQLTDAVQVILVCDGATDGSLERAQQHIAASASPHCYQLLLQANAGVSVARNNGIAQAKADYIGFIDADDIVLPGYFETLVEVIQQQQPDLIEIGYKRFRDCSELTATKERYLHQTSGWLQKEQALKETFAASRWFPWLRLYRKSMLANFQFPAGIAYCEDVMALPALYLQAQRIYHLRLPLYGYREHSASASFHVSAEHQLQVQSFFSALQQKKTYPAMADHLRHILLFNLAYLIYQFQLSTPHQLALSTELAEQFKALIHKAWWSPGFSLRKKLHLAFASYVASRQKNELEKSA